jgi:hypothetical protein
MVVVPPAIPVARPLLLMVATVVSEEVQVTSPDTSRMEPSLNQPAAVNCRVAPAGMLVLAGETTMPLRATSPAQVVRDRAKDPKNNIRKTKLIFLMGTTPGKKSGRGILQAAGSWRLKVKGGNQTPPAQIGGTDFKRVSIVPAPGTCRGDRLTESLGKSETTLRRPPQGSLPVWANS